VPGKSYEWKHNFGGDIDKRTNNDPNPKYECKTVSGGPVIDNPQNGNRYCDACMGKEIPIEVTRWMNPYSLTNLCNVPAVFDSGHAP
jgi:hypothetical protein